jgi:hypothetical protein
VRAAWVDSDEMTRTLALEEARSILLSFHSHMYEDIVTKLKRNDLTFEDLRYELRQAINLAANRCTPDELLVLVTQLHDLSSDE